MSDVMSDVKTVIVMSDVKTVMIVMSENSDCDE